MLVHTVGGFDLNQTAERFFSFGFVCFIPLWLFLRNKTSFYATFEHEFTHLIVGLLFLKKPGDFRATERAGGYTSLYGSNFVISLAPYFLPTLVFLLLPLHLWLDVGYYRYYFVVLGFLTAYHIFSTWDEFGFHQTDITKHGKLFSCSFILFGNIFSYGVLLAFIIGGFRYSWIFIRDGFFASFEIVSYVGMALANFVQQM